jgi:hypothetical protein
MYKVKTPIHSGDIGSGVNYATADHDWAYIIMLVLIGFQFGSLIGVAIGFVIMKLN